MGKTDEALSRAEKFLARKNYPEARKAFGAALALAAPEDRARVNEAIGVCEREMGRERAAVLMARAQKRAGKGDIDEALSCLDEAEACAADVEARGQIEELRRRCLDRRKLQAAQDLEAAGAFAKAAELYGEIVFGADEPRTLIQRAVCLTRAGRSSEGLACLERLPGPPQAQPVADAALLYSCGFVLASAGRYFECLRAWDKIACRDEAFTAQRSAVFSAFARGLLGRLRESGDPLEEEVRYLSASALQRPDLAELALACRRACVERLWEAQRFESARELLLWPGAAPYGNGRGTAEPSSSFRGAAPYGNGRGTAEPSSSFRGAALAEGRAPPALLFPLAKILYRLAETSADHLDEFACVWLDAVHHPAMPSAISAYCSDGDAVRAKLIVMAESLLWRHAQTGAAAAKRAWAFWVMEKSMVAELHALAGPEARAQGLVCPPRQTERAGLCEPILRLLAQRRPFFKDEEHYLRVGACYGGARRGLFHLENGELEQARAALPEAKGPSAPFLDYARARVDFALALEALEKGSARPERLLQRCADLFALAPSYGKELVDKALEAHDSGKLARYEAALRLIHAKRPGAAIGRALSLLHSRLAIRQFNDGAIDPGTLELRLRRSLELDPDNELAHGNLGSAQADSELKRLSEAIALGKNNAAARIAAGSRHAEVQEFFFEFMGRCLLETGKDAPGEQRLLLLLEMKKMCAAVDAAHPILDQIEALLAPARNP